MVQIIILEKNVNTKDVGKDIISVIKDIFYGLLRVHINQIQLSLLTFF